MAAGTTGIGALAAAGARHRCAEHAAAHGARTGAAAPPAAPAEEDPVAKLAKFKQMLDAGLITQADYDAAKNKVLGL
jgi:membrane protease subunit (stomatin/prohibitin family)